MPGISAITITPGPEPATYTRLALPSSVISRRATSSSGSSSFRVRTAIAVVLESFFQGREDGSALGLQQSHEKLGRLRVAGVAPPPRRIRHLEQSSLLARVVREIGREQ